MRGSLLKPRWGGLANEDVAPSDIVSRAKKLVKHIHNVNMGKIRNLVVLPGRGEVALSLVDVVRDTAPRQGA